MTNTSKQWWVSSGAEARDPSASNGDGRLFRDGHCWYFLATEIRTTPILCCNSITIGCLCAGSGDVQKKKGPWCGRMAKYAFPRWRLRDIATQIPTAGGWRISAPPGFGSRTKTPNFLFFFLFFDHCPRFFRGRFRRPRVSQFACFIARILTTRGGGFVS